MREHGVFDAQPAGARDEIARLAREEALIEPFRREEVVRVLAALAAAGVPALVFKGTALAYTRYPDPALRPRLDTDLFIRLEDVAHRVARLRPPWVRKDAPAVRRACDSSVRVRQLAAFVQARLRCPLEAVQSAGVRGPLLVQRAGR